jgi:hypothetical protein
MSGSRFLVDCTPARWYGLEKWGVMDKDRAERLKGVPLENMTPEELHDCAILTIEAGDRENFAPAQNASYTRAVALAGLATYKATARTLIMEMLTPEERAYVVSKVGEDCGGVLGPKPASEREK